MLRPGTFQRMLRKVAATAFPSASPGVFGATVTVLAGGAGAFPNLETTAVRIQPTGVGVETLTVNVFFNFSDGATQNFQATFVSTNTLQDLALGNLLVNAHRDGQTCTSVTGNCSSSIASSGANATINWAGFVTE